MNIEKLCKLCRRFFVLFLVETFFVSLLHIVLTLFIYYLFVILNFFYVYLKNISNFYIINITSSLALFTNVQCKCYSKLNNKHFTLELVCTDGSYNLAHNFQTHTHPHTFDKITMQTQIICKLERHQLFFVCAAIQQYIHLHICVTYYNKSDIQIKYTVTHCVRAH